MKTSEAILKKKDNKYTIVASTNSVDRDNEIIEPKSFSNLEKYLAKNPVILFGHNYSIPPVGKALNAKVVDNALIMDIEFAQTEFGKEIKYLYDNGFMNTFSVGFIPKDWDVNGQGQRVYTKTELLEVSAVPVPANADATVLRACKEYNLNNVSKYLTETDNQTTESKVDENQEEKATEKVSVTQKLYKLWSR